MSAIAMTVISITSVNAQVMNDIKVVSGMVDTVINARHTIIGTTKSGSDVYINGNKVKQYKSGSFGTMIDLVSGDNPVEIKTLYDGVLSEKKFSVYYKVGKSDKKITDQAGDSFSSTPHLVVTKPGAYLNYGAGQDRLGGAKINFLSEGIRMELLDSVGSLFKVRLSERNYAFIPKEYADKAKPGSKLPFSLTGSWSVSNAGDVDRVTLNLEERQPYTVRHEKNPDRIVIDIYGAACNSNWITQYFGLKVIDYVDFQQIQPDVFRVVLNLKNKYSWGYNLEYSNNNLIINVKHGPKPKMKGMVIGIDAGHGGSASGAVSPSGFKEKDLNLAMAYMLKQELERRGARVVLSRKDDSDISMGERLSVFRRENIDLLVSIHCNAGGNPLVAGGSSTYYRHIEYRDLAASILKRLIKLEGVKNFGLIGNFNFSLNAPTMFPSVLVETLFMSSLPDEEKIVDKEFQKKMMKQVAKGLEDYLKKVRDGI